MLDEYNRRVTKLKRFSRTEINFLLKKTKDFLQEIKVTKVSIDEALLLSELIKSFEEADERIRVWSG